MAEGVRAAFFIFRENEVMIPLVALDELPDHIVIKDVPAILQSGDVQGMQCLGKFPARHVKHTVTNLNQSPHTSLRERGLYASIHAPHSSPPARSEVQDVRTASPKTVGSVHSPLTRRNIVGAPARVPTGQNIDTEHRKDVMNTSTGASTGEQASPPRAAPGRKEYCSYWLRKGECDYKQQGCMYKHEMPTDLETLRQLGLRDIPQWFRQEHKLGSFLAVEGAPASFRTGGVHSLLASGACNDRLSTRVLRERRQPRGTQEVTTHGNGRGRSRRQRQQNGKGGAQQSGRYNSSSSVVGSTTSRTPTNVRNPVFTGPSKLRRHESITDRGVHQQPIAETKLSSQGKVTRPAAPEIDLLLDGIVTLGLDNPSKAVDEHTAQPQARIQRGYRSSSTVSLIDDDGASRYSSNSNSGTARTTPGGLQRKPSIESTIDCEGDLVRCDTERRSKEIEHALRQAQLSMHRGRETHLEHVVAVEPELNANDNSVRARDRGERPEDKPTLAPEEV